jgi:hypothetical protein
MKTKLTVTIDQELLPRAKAYARQSGNSLSELIENALRDLSAGAQPDFATRWRGKFSPGDDQRRRRLLEKYA